MPMGIAMSPHLQLHMSPQTTPQITHGLRPQQVQQVQRAPMQSPMQPMQPKQQVFSITLATQQPMQAQEQVVQSTPFPALSPSWRV
jgi:hypothetical protein